EKPMAQTPAECVRLVQTSERTGRMLQIGHVLRFTPFFARLHEIVESGRLGQIISVEHRENIVYWHMAHSFLRGHWRNLAASSPRAVISEINSVEARMEALRTGPYGRCVYHCDNDVVDNQVVAMEMESGVSVSMNFVGHSHREGRTLRIDGSRATLRGKFIGGDSQIEIDDHLT